MKKTKQFVIILLVGWVSSLQAQNIRINVDNPEPRLGQEIELTIETDFFEGILKSAFSDGIEFAKSNTNQDLTKILLARRLGPMTIGPLKFEFNGVTYTSNSLMINVIPSLEDKEGIWIRMVKMDGKNCIVIEQIEIIQPITTGSANNLKIEWKSPEENLVKLIDKLEDKDIEFFEFKSGTGGSPDKIKDHPPSVSYSYKFYEIKKGDHFKGPFKLKAEHFENLPKGTKIPEIVID